MISVLKIIKDLRAANRETCELRNAKSNIAEVLQNAIRKGCVVKIHRGPVTPARPYLFTHMSIHIPSAAGRAKAGPRG